MISNRSTNSRLCGNKVEQLRALEAGMSIVVARVDAVLEQHHEHVDATNARFSKLDADLNEVRTTSSQFRETMIAAIGDRPTRKEIADQFADMKTFIRDLFATIKTQK